jgi:formylglycine-generating enzyme required for sulfatase activity
VVNAGLDLTDEVTAPVKGAVPITTAIDGTQYTGTVAWKGSDGTTAVSGNFAAATVYKAVVTLTAESGFTFTGFAGTFSHTSATDVSYAAGVVTITFPATAAEGAGGSFSTPAQYREMVLAAPNATDTVTITGDSAYDASNGNTLFPSGRTVMLSPFKMAKYETTCELWYEVKQWAGSKGYSFANAGSEGHNGRDGAARGEGTPSTSGSFVYTYAGGNAVGDVAWYNDSSGGVTHFVDRKTANTLGLYDMSGTRVFVTNESVISCFFFMTSCFPKHLIVFDRSCFMIFIAITAFQDTIRVGINRYVKTF